MKLQLYDDSTFMLHDVCYVPELQNNLISTGQLDDMEYHTTFDAQKWKIVKASMVVARGRS